MTNKLQSIEGGPLLDALKELLFKGLSSLFNGSGSYEEEDNIIKQVTKISIRKQDEDEIYTLTIKLSPVKDQDDVYYIELSCDDPALDLSSLNKKTIKLDQNNQSSFEKRIDKFLSDAGYERIPEYDTEEDQDTDEGDSDLSKEQVREVENLENELEEELSTLSIEAIDADQNPVKIELDVVEDKKIKKCTISVSVVGENGQNQNYPKEVYECDTVDKDNKPLTFPAFYKEVKSCIREYAVENELEIQDKVFTSTKIADAQFILASDGSGVELTAINASTSIKAAMEAIEEIAESDDFTSLLKEDPVSFSISEDDEGYVIDEINEVDVSSSYCDLFKEVCIVNSAFKTYQWAIGRSDWYTDSFLSGSDASIGDLLENCAIWVINHTDKFPNVIGTFGNDCTDLADLKDEEGISLDKIHDQTKAMLEGLVEVLDIYYVNLEHEEQKLVDDFMNSANQLLTYA